MQLAPVPLKACVNTKPVDDLANNLHIEAYYISLWIVLVCIAVASGVEQILDPQNVIETYIGSAVLVHSREREIDNRLGTFGHA